MWSRLASGLGSGSVAGAQRLRVALGRSVGSSVKSHPFRSVGSSRRFFSTQAQPPAANPEATSSSSSGGSAGGNRAGAQVPPVASNKNGLLYALACLLGAGGVAYMVFSGFGERTEKEERALEEKRKAAVVEVFNKHASIKKSGVALMTSDDFLNGLAEIYSTDATKRLTINPAKLRALFKIADRDKSGLISLEEFLLFEKAVSTPFADYEIAFHLFDKDSDNRITKAEFIKVMQAVDESTVPFDLDSEFVRLYWGVGDQKPMSFRAFSQMLKSLQAERLKQMFKYYDKQQTGYIKEEEFKTILDTLKRQNLPAQLKEKLGHIGDLNMRKGHITYAQFSAVQGILMHMPSYERILRVASNSNSTTPISKEKFLHTAYAHSTVEITPMELDILFHVFSQDGKTIQLSNFLNVLEKAPGSSLGGAHAHPQGAVGRIKESATNFAIGSVAGGIGATAVYPIDLVKTRMQNQRAVKAEERLYKNSFDCFWKVITREGFLGLYKGLIPQLVGVAPEKAIKLTVNDLLRSLFEDKSKGEIYFPLEVLAGAGAGASQVIFTNPLEIVKIRLQVAGEVGARPSAVSIMQQLGFVGLYKGASACFLRDIPFSAIYFPTYAKMKIILADENGKLSKLDLLLAGAIAGVPAASLVTPADVIKTRLQVEARKGEATYSGIADCAAKIYATEGPSAFFKGAGARVFRSSPQFGITLLSYEILQSYLAPDLPARPPTNAPVTQKDIDSIRSQAILRVANLEERWRLSN